ncbi:hypothetical protein E1B28_001237 [Marasmius oreades]|uniref:Uncharacterized protein n=1 Tax=Marasmius oreades TaxID=181124 RepID=A0A9P7V3B6_9AGAR|nr:uncharacterized protein E1B28_001237 [Marasmius oreades]KAG7099382.1 hypothetical protein E1B28_001237 [Marasmius oreades]
MDTTTSQEPSNVSTPANENDIIHSEPLSSQHSPKEAPTPTRSLKIYTRAHILALHKSPLVSIPNGMPELKDWFGTENEQNLNRKDSEPSTPNSGRERRFRRDAEDGDLPPRPSFRSTASQPSQMGNFKHQSLRSSDRDLDRDREGERLRNFDRDRLSISGLRNKERDVAPHFSTGSSRGTTQQGTIAARRLEGRDGTRKEDWRRGNDSRRSERSEITRDERDPRRDSSRTRRDPSSSRRDHDTRRERERDREEYRRERDRDEPRRDREDAELDDPKKWREEGRRDPRRERGREKPSHENSWENGDRRWGLAEDKDRAKKGTGRDKKSNATDDFKDREERRSEREKEKEPAWMDTYIPSSSGGGILGGKGSDGELDGIQAWKKNMKEKEQQAQKALNSADHDAPGVAPQRENPEEQMDEIQRFKKMMELAQKQKGSQTESLATNPSISAAEPLTDTTSSGGRKSQEDVPTVKTSPIPATDPSQSLLSLLASADVSRTPSSQPTPISTISNNSISKPSKATDSPLTVERTPDSAPTSSITGTAPQGSRLLALGSRAPIKPQPNSQASLPNGTMLPLAVQPVHKASLPIGPVQVVPKAPSRASNSFSPFEEQREHGEILRQATGERHLPSEAVGWPDSSNFDHPTSGHSVGRGSRFAKFFDAKVKETSVQPPALPKSTTPVGFVSSSPIPGQRQDPVFHSVNSPIVDENVTVEDLFAKLSMGTQLQRSNPQHSAQGPSLGFGHQTQNIQHFQQQQQLQSQHLHQHNNTRLETFTESRNFTPDGLVPGLRSVPPPRTRDNGMFQDSIDEAVLLNAQQRLALQQQRGYEQLYPGSLSTGFGQQGNRSVGLSLQQQQFRGGPSPTLQGPHVPLQQQRLPPGLANLGGRPPHDPTQLLGLQGSLGSQLHGLQVNPQQQGFSNFHPQPTNVGFGGPQPQLRGPPPGSAHTLPAHQLGGLGLPGGLDLRNANQQQSQLLAMSSLGGGALRGVGNNGYNPVSSAQLQNPLLAQMRQQQQPPPQLPPHMIPHMIPPHLQQPGPVTGNQSAQDLMALLMGGAHHRE